MYLSIYLTINYILNDPDMFILFHFPIANLSGCELYEGTLSLKTEHHEIPAT